MSMARLPARNVFGCHSLIKQKDNFLLPDYQILANREQQWDNKNTIFHGTGNEDSFCLKISSDEATQHANELTGGDIDMISHFDITHIFLRKGRDSSPMRWLEATHSPLGARIWTALIIGQREWMTRISKWTGVDELWLSTLLWLCCDFKSTLYQDQPDRPTVTTKITVRALVHSSLAFNLSAMHKLKPVKRDVALIRLT